VNPRYLFPFEVWNSGATEFIGDPLQYGPLEDFEPTGWDERKGFAELEALAQGPAGGYEITSTELISDGNFDEIIGDDGTEGVENEIIGSDGTDEIIGSEDYDPADDQMMAGFDMQTLALLGAGGLAAYLTYRHGHPGTQAVVVPSAVPGGPGEAMAVPQEVEAPPGDGGGGGGDSGGGGGGGGYAPAPATPPPMAPPPAAPALTINPGTTVQQAVQALAAVPTGTQIQVPEGAIPGIPKFTATTPEVASKFIVQQAPRTVDTGLLELRTAIQNKTLIAGGLLQLLTKMMTPEEASIYSKIPALRLQAGGNVGKAAMLAKQGKATEAAAAAKLGKDLGAQADQLDAQWRSSFLSRTATMAVKGWAVGAATSIFTPVARVSGNVLVPIAKLPVALAAGALGTSANVVGNVLDVIAGALGHRKHRR
jgi:hypothetical protein